MRALTTTLLRSARLVPDELVEVEAERFAALIDGTLHPAELGAVLACAVVHRHLATLVPDHPAGER
ncbi:hypothetical protein [Amycolatopsis taiwanensis]|uniref:Uncharacterized protein n=1 Tax=Amycolatopsis taiwanensis TaxID=342230 RepID=A0A9W6QVQ7_9PSEU|nr:hypothetical protein Atai01_01000 [Amycolatopsis taiwanensis]